MSSETQNVEEFIRLMGEDDAGAMVYDEEHKTLRRVNGTGSPEGTIRLNDEDLIFSGRLEVNGGPPRRLPGLDRSARR